ncbi:MAG: YbaK/EbsC family protein [Verrucomicrobia bacterium]|nr:YbaK/EbsC family protein [Verrucomicrobiota bacterium]
MTCLERIEQYLKQQGVRYEVLHHACAFTAQRVAQAEHIPGKMQAKVVMLRSGGQFYMAVLPAVAHLDVGAFTRVAGKPCKLATEAEFKHLFPDCEIGAMPPLGSFYMLPVYADDLLEEDDEIVMQAGTHTESVKLAWDDYLRLERPTLVQISHRAQV